MNYVAKQAHNALLPDENSDNVLSTFIKLDAPAPEEQRASLWDLITERTQINLVK